MAEADEFRQKAKESVKKVVKEIVSDFSSQMAKMATKKVIKKCKEHVRKKTLHKLEESLKDIAEQGLDGHLEKSAERVARQLNRSIDQVTERVAKGSFEHTDFVTDIERDFETAFKKCLRSPLKSLLITFVTLVGVAVVVWAVPRFVIPSERPDLAIRDMWHEPENGGVTIHYTIVNWGESQAGWSDTCLYYDGSPIDQHTVEPIPPGEEVQMSFTLSDFPQYDFTVEIRADDNYDIDETHEDNNSREYSYREPLPDLVILADIEHEYWGENEGVTINYTIKNQGEAQVERSVTRLHPSHGPTVEQPIDPIPPGQTKRMSCHLEDLPECGFTVTITADADHDNVESDEYNNSREYTEGSGLLCVEFEDPPLGTEYHVRDTFTDSGVVIDIKQFQWNNEVWTSDGFALVENDWLAGGSGQEIHCNNVNLDFDFGDPWEGLSLLFGEYGGNLNIEINGDFRNFENFQDIGGDIIGGVDVSVFNGFGNDRGNLNLSGTINSFTIGGQELWIDDVCPTVPCE